MRISRTQGGGGAEGLPKAGTSITRGLPNGPTHRGALVIGWLGRGMGPAPRGATVGAHPSMASPTVTRSGGGRGGEPKGVLNKGGRQEVNGATMRCHGSGQATSSVVSRSLKITLAVSAGPAASGKKRAQGI